MSDYSQGKIYMLTSEQTPEVYIGSTKKTLEERMKSHKNKYKSWLEGKFQYNTSFEIIKYDDCKIHLLEDYPCETRKELEKKEGEYQRMMGCVNKRIEGRTKKEYRENNKEHIKQRMKEYRSRPEVKEHIKKQSKEYNSKLEAKERKKEYYKNNKEKFKEYLQRPAVKEHRKEYDKEYYQKNKEHKKLKIKCVCGSEHRKADTRRHQRSQKHIRYIEEMKEKADSTNLNEFFEQFKFKLETK